MSSSLNNGCLLKTPLSLQTSLSSPAVFLSCNLHIIGLKGKQTLLCYLQLLSDLWSFFLSNDLLTSTSPYHWLNILAPNPFTLPTHTPFTILAIQLLDDFWKSCSATAWTSATTLMVIPRTVSWLIVGIANSSISSMPRCGHLFFSL